MVVLELAEGQRKSSVRADPPQEEPTVNAAAVSRETEFVVGVRSELDDYMVRLKTCHSRPPDDVFLMLSAITTRLAEIRMILVRTDSRRMTALRTREIDPMLEQCDRLFRLHSRIQTVRSMEYDQMGKMT